MATPTTQDRKAGSYLEQTQAALHAAEKASTKFEDSTYGSKYASFEREISEMSSYISKANNIARKLMSR